MKQTINMTLSLSPALVARLHKSLPKRKISRFTANALNKALDELQDKENGELEKAYAKAFRDEVRENESRDWNTCDEDKIENWEWYEQESS